MIKLSEILEKPMNDKINIEIEVFMTNLIDNWIRGFVEGYTGETIENLLKSIQEKADITDLDLENTKEEIFDDITRIIFKKHPGEIEKLESKVIKLAKEGMTSNDILDKLLK